MDLQNLIRDAKLDLFFMSGSGLGAVLLAVVAIVFLCLRKRTPIDFRNWAEVLFKKRDGRS